MGELWTNHSEEIIAVLSTIIIGVGAFLVKKGYLTKMVDGVLKKVFSANKRKLVKSQKELLKKHKVFYSLTRFIQSDLILLYRYSKQDITAYVFVYMLFIKFSEFKTALLNYLDGFKDEEFCQEEHLNLVKLFATNIDSQIEAQWIKRKIPKEVMKLFALWDTTRVGWYLPTVEHAIINADTLYKEISDFLDASWFFLVATLEDSKKKVDKFNGESEKHLTEEIVKMLDFNYPDFKIQR